MIIRADKEVCLKKTKDIKITMIRIALIGFALLAWELSARKGLYNTIFTSYPSEILLDLKEFYLSGELIKHSSITLKEASLGLLYGTLTGILFGLILSQIKALGSIFVPIITAIHGVPQLTLAPVYVLWFGLGLTSKIFLSGLMVFFNVFFATYAGANNIEPKLVESAKILCANRLETLFLVIFPTSLPWILSGIKSGLGSCLVGAIIGEYIGASAGFGWMISYATSFFNISRVMSCILILLVVGVVINHVMDAVEGWLLRWQ